MTLVGQPIPPLDHTPSPVGAPPGIGVDIDFYHAWNDGKALPGTLWWPGRPIIDPIGAVIHTNAASVEASLLSSKRHGNRGQNNTKPHYNFNGPVPEKNVPTDRRAIANSTGSSIEQQYGCPDSSFWLLAFETADKGYNQGTTAPDGSLDLGPFLYNHDELIARALAYEAIVHNFPLVIPTQFYTPGVYTHTAPWPYPHLTTARGKTCPTYTKKQQILDPNSEIMARAREIYATWTGAEPPPPLPPGIAFDPYNGKYGLWPLNAAKPWIKVGSKGDAVKYAQGVLRNKGGQDIFVDGDFGPQTEGAVRNLQIFFGIKNTGSINYGGKYADDTWAIIDGLVVGFPDQPVEPPVVVPPPTEPPPPPPAEKNYISVGTGRYYLLPGESPWAVSTKVYGTGSRYGDLQTLNPGTWHPGQIIRCPDVPGRTRQAVAGEGAYAILRDFFPGDNPADHLDDFYFWNGGEGRVIQPGDWVYCPV